MSQTTKAAPAGSQMPDITEIAGEPLLGGISNYPGGTPGSCRFPRREPHFPSGYGLPRYIGGSASTLNLSRPARRSLALRPANSPTRLTTRFLEGSGGFVTSTTAPIATGWSD